MISTKNTVDFTKAQNPFGDAVVKASQEHAEQCWPEESVGIVVDFKYVPLKNVHPEPENHFRVSPDVLVEYANNIQAVIHSHPLETHLSRPSFNDMKAQLDWNIPFGIQLVNEESAGNIVWFGDGIEIAHYVGRPYIFGVYDCFSVWRDYYRTELGIELKNFAREDEFWIKGDNLYYNHAEECGFSQIDPKDIQANDIVLLKIRSKIANHGIIYLGGDMGLHHLPYKLSSRDLVSKYINTGREMFDSVWRYTQ